MAYTNIPDGVLTPRSPLSSQTLRTLRDNITRIERGAPITIQSLEQGTSSGVNTNTQRDFAFIAREINPPLGKIFLGVEVPKNFGIRFSTISPPEATTNAVVTHIPRPAVTTDDNIDDDTIAWTNYTSAGHFTGVFHRIGEPILTSTSTAGSGLVQPFLWADRITMPRGQLRIRYTLTADSGSQFQLVAFCQMTPIYADLGGLDVS